MTEILNYYKSIENVNKKQYTIKDSIVNKCIKNYILMFKYNFGKIKTFLIEMKIFLNKEILREIINEFYHLNDKFSVMNILLLIENELDIKISSLDLNKEIYTNSIEFLFELL